jgi:hypothetical protein
MMRLACTIRNLGGEMSCGLYACVLHETVRGKHRRIDGSIFTGGTVPHTAGARWAVHDNTRPRRGAATQGPGPHPALAGPGLGSTLTPQMPPRDLAPMARPGRSALNASGTTQRCVSRVHAREVPHTAGPAPRTWEPSEEGQHACQVHPSGVLVEEVGRLPSPIARPRQQHRMGPKPRVRRPVAVDFGSRKASPLTGTL